LNPRKATSLDLPDIESIWESVFSDSADFVNRFIAHFGIGCCYVCEINKVIVAMAFSLPTALNLKVQRFKDLEVQQINNSNLSSQISGHTSQISDLTSLLYVYACATLPPYRKQGVMAKLLETIYAEACRENIAGIFLHAANPDLENYYRKLGFEDFFYQSSAEFISNHKGYKRDTKNTVRFITPEVYYQKRVQKLEDYCFVNWNESFFNFLSKTEIQFCEYENDIFSFRIENQSIIIDELLGDTPKEEIAPLLFKHFPDFKTVEICYPGQEKCYGQIKWCKLQNENLHNGYFAYAME